MTWAIDERHMSVQEKLSIAMFAIGCISFLRSIRLVALRSWAYRASVQLGVSITKLDGNISDLFFLMSYGLKILKKIKTRLLDLLTFTPEIARTKVDLP
jgi:hypothetical protein